MEKEKRFLFGDTITFTNTADTSETLNVKVTDLFIFNSFDELYENVQLIEYGYTNKRIAITITAVFLLHNGYMASGNLYFREMENISYHVAAGT